MTGQADKRFPVFPQSPRKHLISHDGVSVSDMQICTEETLT